MLKVRVVLMVSVEDACRLVLLKVRVVLMVSVEGACHVNGDC